MESRTGLQARLALLRPDEERAWRCVLHGAKDARRSRQRWRAGSVKVNPIGVNRCFSARSISALFTRMGSDSRRFHRWHGSPDWIFKVGQTWPRCAYPFGQLSAGYLRFAAIPVCLFRGETSSSRMARMAANAMRSALSPLKRLVLLLFLCKDPPWPGRSKPDRLLSTFTTDSPAAPALPPHCPAMT